MMSTATTFTRWFDDLRATDRDRAGGKCANLGELISVGIPVPRGFAITVTAFEEFCRASSLLERIGNDPVHAQARQVMRDAPMPESIEREIREGYAALCELAGTGDLPVAVRSSAVAEDGAAASFAGQQETFLWVSGADDVLSAVRECWASLFTPQAVAYRQRLDDAARDDALRLAVGVQEMVDAQVAGVAFTVSPTTGDRSVVAINAAWGLGEAVVSGEVTPDEYWLSKIGPTLTRSTIATKQHRRVPNPAGSGTALEPVPADLAEAPCMDADRLVELTQLAMRVEKHYGHPQDIEWALTADGRFVLLQTRPETVHANRPEDAAAKPAATASWLSTIQGIGAKVGGQK